MKKNKKLTIVGITKIIGENVGTHSGNMWFVRTVKTDDDWYEFVCSDTTMNIPIRLLRNSEEGLSRSGWNWQRPDNTNSYITPEFSKSMANVLLCLDREIHHHLS